MNAVKKMIYDAFRFGTGITKHGPRKWFNPLRYICGKHYTKRVNLKDVFK